LQFVPCEFNINFFNVTLILFTISGTMAPKETKRDRERRLKAQEQEATDAAPDGPTDDDASPEVPIQYDAEGVVRPGTSSAAAAASSTAPGTSAAAAVAKVGSLSMSSDLDSDGVAREKERPAIPAKRASRSNWSRSKVPKKKAKK
jgi:hypothetical protein